jgi:hypothetical protein
MSSQNARNRILLVRVFGAGLAIGALALVLVMSSGDSEIKSSATADEASAVTGELAAGFGGDAVKNDLWKKLATYRSSYLSSWSSDAFTRPNPRAATVLAAFKQVAEKVSGPDGFWRETVPNEVFSCASQPESAVCRNLDSSFEELRGFDTLISRLDRLDSSRADVFLSRNHAELGKYLETYVPDQPSAESMRQTAFYADKLEKWVAAGNKVESGQ